MGINNSKIDEYINEICSYVRYKQAHDEIKAELLDHFEEKLEDQMKEGLEENELVEKALLEMGDAEFIGKQLNESHKSAPELGIILLTIMLSFIGMFSIYFIVTNGIYSNRSIFYKSAGFNILGYFIIASLYFFDYRILERYSKSIYIIVTVILFLQLITGTYINGTQKWINIGIISVDITELSLFLYAVALSKILKELDWNNIKQVMKGFIMAFVPLVLYASLNTTMPILIYLMLFLTLMIAAKSKLRYIVRMFIAAKKVKDRFGSLIIQSFMCIFALEFVWNIFMVLGFAPIVSVGLPFISYGGTSAITQMAAVGIILSIYRRKNLSSTTTVSIKA